MKIQIDADVPNGDAKKTFAAIRNALVQKETAELIDAFPAGEHFSMYDDRAGIKIIITKL